MTEKTQWLDRCAFELPYCYRLCVTEKGFHKELKRLKLPRSVWPRFLKSDHSSATCHFFESSNGQYCAIVCVRKEEAKKKSNDAVCGLLVHEAMHIWRACRELYGELDPSAELEAYAMQRISQNLIWSWEQQKGTKSD